MHMTHSEAEHPLEGAGIKPPSEGRVRLDITMLPERGTKMRGKMFTNNKIVCVVTFLIFAVLLTQAQENGTFSIQDSVLLFGQFEQDSG